MVYVCVWGGCVHTCVHAFRGWTLTSGVDPRESSILLFQWRRLSWDSTIRPNWLTSKLQDLLSLPLQCLGLYHSLPFLNLCSGVWTPVTMLCRKRFTEFNPILNRVPLPSFFQLHIIWVEEVNLIKGAQEMEAVLRAGEAASVYLSPLIGLARWKIHRLLGEVLSMLGEHLLCFR